MFLFFYFSSISLSQSNTVSSLCFSKLFIDSLTILFSITGACSITCISFKNGFLSNELISYGNLGGGNEPSVYSKPSLDVLLHFKIVGLAMSTSGINILKPPLVVLTKLDGVGNTTISLTSKK